MSVIVELALPADDFELGRVLGVEGSTTVALETMVPLGEGAVPFVRLSHPGYGRRDFENRARGSGAVEDLTLISSHDDEALYALDWDVSRDTFLEAVRAEEGHVLDATGSGDTWWFGIRFETHDTLSTFQTRCLDAGVGIDVERVYNPTRPDAGPWYGVTPPQREALVRAVEAGYYSIPRGISTQELADEFGISDQALTERLRRAIITLVTNTLAVSEQQD